MIERRDCANGSPHPPHEWEWDGGAMFCVGKGGSRIVGRRREDWPEGGPFHPGGVRVGDYWKVLADDGSPKIVHHPGKLTEECWCVVLPLGGIGIGNLANHTVREHEDGTISVRPNDGSSNSILVQKGADGPSWHGYIERGVLYEA